MELNITELTNFEEETNNDYSFENYNNEPIASELGYEKIPENNVPIKVIKKGVHFKEPLKPMHQSMPRVNAKIVRQQTPTQKPKISYEDILTKMGMFVSDGKLHLIDRNTLTPQKHQELLATQNQSRQLENEVRIQQNRYHQQQQSQQQSQQQMESNIPQNSYIYNKFFKDNLQVQNTVRKPQTLEEYKRMLIEDYIQRQRIKQMKSTKLVMPTSNINISAGHSANLNKLFSFSKR